MVKEAGGRMCQGGHSRVDVTGAAAGVDKRSPNPVGNLAGKKYGKLIDCGHGVGGGGQGGRAWTRGGGEGQGWGLVWWQQDLISEGPAKLSGLLGDCYAAAMGDSVTFFGVIRDAHGFSCCVGWWSGLLFGITNATASSVESKTKGDEGGVDGRVHNFGGARGSGESYCSWWSRDGRGLANEGGSG